MNRHGFNSQLTTGSQYAQGDLATVGYDHFF
jgi:hypothetical protein